MYVASYNCVAFQKALYLNNNISPSYLVPCDNGINSYYYILIMCVYLIKCK